MNPDPHIDTVSGRKISFLHPELDQIDIEDVAHGTSFLCRFNGHCKVFYSVAEHSVRVSWLLPTKLKLAGLLHDGHEGLGLADMISPAKKVIPQYKEVELIMEAAVAKRFGLSFPYPKAVKKADLIMLATEMRDLKPHSYYKDLPYAPLREHIKPWSPARARTMFLKEFRKLYRP